MLLNSIVSTSDHTKCLLLSNQKCMTQPTVINLHCNEYSQELHYCLFPFNLDRCAESYNTLDEWSNKVYAPKEIEDLNLQVFNIIT